MKEKIFINGLMFKSKRDKTPEYVKGHISIKVKELIEFLKGYTEYEWLNADLKKSAKTGKLYIELNTYGMNKQSELTEEEKAKILEMKKPPEIANSTTDPYF